MTDATPRASVPLLSAAQAQKHVTHNDALLEFDALLCCRILDRDLSDPPASPADGDAYLVKAAGTGLWTGQDGNIAYAIDGGWRFYTPFGGLSAFIADEAVMLVYTASGWADWASLLNLQNLPQLGVNTSADAANKLAVKSAALLFDNVGADVQAKLNKAASIDTASILYQTSYSGRAEIGLTGDDNFHFKVSPDGASWLDAIAIDAATGRVGIATDTPSAALDVAGGMNALNAMGIMVSGNNIGNSFSATGAGNAAGDGQIIGTVYSATITGANDTGYNAGLRLNGIVSGTAGTTTSMRAAYCNVVVSNAMALTYGVGMDAAPYIQGSANMANWTAFAADAPVVSGSGDITGTITGFSIAAMSRAAATTFQGITIADQTAPSGNAYGIVSSLSAASNKWNLYIGGSAQNYLAGALGLGTNAPSCQLDVNDDHLRLRTAKTPASATDSGNAGDICWDAGYVYVCVAANTWKRAALTSW
jgi:hypothetical protein